MQEVQVDHRKGEQLPVQFGRLGFWEGRAVSVLVPGFAGGEAARLQGHVSLNYITGPGNNPKAWESSSAPTRWDHANVRTQTSMQQPLSRLKGHKSSARGGVRGAEGGNITTSDSKIVKWNRRVIGHGDGDRIWRRFAQKKKKKGKKGKKGKIHAGIQRMIPKKQDRSTGSTLYGGYLPSIHS